MNMREQQIVRENDEAALIQGDTQTSKEEEDHDMFARGVWPSELAYQRTCWKQPVGDSHLQASHSRQDQRR